MLTCLLRRTGPVDPLKMKPPFDRTMKKCALEWAEKIAYHMDIINLYMYYDMFVCMSSNLRS